MPTLMQPEMKLVRTCRSCGEEILSASKACEHCGRSPIAGRSDAVPKSQPTSTGMKRCPFCAEVIQNAAIICKHFDRDFTSLSADPRHAISQSRVRLLGLIGAALLADGGFVPIIRSPIVGSINYFRNGSGDGTIILAVAAIAALVAAIRRADWLLPCGVTSLGLLTIFWFSISQKMADIQSSMARDLKGNPFAGIAEAMTQSMQLEWGWAVMVAGSVLLLAGAFIEGKRPSWLAIGTTVLLLAPLAGYAYIEALLLLRSERHRYPQTVRDARKDGAGFQEAFHAGRHRQRDRMVDEQLRDGQTG